MYFLGLFLSLSLSPSYFVFSRFLFVGTHATGKSTVPVCLSPFYYFPPFSVLQPLLLDWRPFSKNNRGMHHVSWVLMDSLVIPLPHKLFLPVIVFFLSSLRFQSTRSFHLISADPLESDSKDVSLCIHIWPIRKSSKHSYLLFQWVYPRNWKSFLFSQVKEECKQ